jgi:cytochrome c-type biogenesis protein CcmH
MIRALVFLLLLAPGLAGAVEPRERLADPALEARARAISQTLRCLVCQNESIDESGADLARDIRVLLRERLLAGASDAAARRFIVDRYGDFVLLKPPLEKATLLLWFAPALLLVIGGIGVVLHLRRRPPEAPPDLTEEERRRLARILGETDA